MPFQTMVGMMVVVVVVVFGLGQLFVRILLLRLVATAAATAAAAAAVAAGVVIAALVAAAAVVLAGALVVGSRAVVDAADWIGTHQPRNVELCRKENKPFDFFLPMPSLSMTPWSQRTRRSSIGPPRSRSVPSGARARTRAAATGVLVLVCVPADAGGGEPAWCSEDWPRSMVMFGARGREGGG